MLTRLEMTHQFRTPVRVQVKDQIGAQVYGQARYLVLAQISGIVFAQVWTQIRGQIEESL